MESIRVHVVRYKSSKNLVMRYRCPSTGKQIIRSTGTTNRKDAERVAAKWEAELQEGRYSRDGRMSWEELRLYWEETKLPSVKPKTAANYASTMNAFELLCRPQRAADLTTPRVTAFATELRRKGLSEASVGRHLRGLKAIAKWAKGQGILARVPAFEMPKAAARMKGRPITGEEFDRMLAVTESVVGERAAESFRNLLRGLWWSGLRLGEALSLTWEQQPGGVWLILRGDETVLAFDVGSQKSGKAELVPVAPEAVDLFGALPRDGRFVFPIVNRDGAPASRRVLAVGRKLQAIGKAAGVVTDAEKGRTATAHDLRRSFGHRWSRRVMPATLKELMRHASIDTTMTYYVGQSAATTTAELRTALGIVSGISGGSPSQVETPETKKPLRMQGL